MVLSHEDATSTARMPYLRCRLTPLPVLEFIGRSAKRFPPCKPQECVWHWMQDSLPVALICVQFGFIQDQILNSSMLREGDVTFPFGILFSWPSYEIWRLSSNELKVSVHIQCLGEILLRMSGCRTCRTSDFPTTSCLFLLKVISAFMSMIVLQEAIGTCCRSCLLTRAMLGAPPLQLRAGVRTEDHREHRGGPTEVEPPAHLQTLEHFPASAHGQQVVVRLSEV